jgi:hypothetical protein
MGYQNPRNVCTVPVSTPEKTRLVDFGRFGRERAKRQGKKPAAFDFLGYVASKLMFCHTIYDTWPILPIVALRK